jgi:energy-coupling factor transporter ATP-binding protein EcfA2
MRIQSTNSVAENKIKAIIAGPSGSGKTTQVKHLKALRPLLISAESGLLSVAGTGIDFLDISKDDSGNLIPKENRIKRLMEVYQYILTPEAREKYGLIYIDSLTEISQVLFDHLRKEYPERKDNLVLYGELGQKMRDIIKAFRDVPHYHVIMSCLTTVDKDDSGRRFAAFDLIGSIKDRLPQFFDLVLYLRVTAEGGREIVCNQTDAITAKDRSGRLSPVEPADLGAIITKAIGVNK